MRRRDPSKAELSSKSSFYEKICKIQEILQKSLNLRINFSCKKKKKKPSRICSGLAYMHTITVISLNLYSYHLIKSVLFKITKYLLVATHTELSSLLMLFYNPASCKPTSSFKKHLLNLTLSYPVLSTYW